MRNNKASKLKKEALLSYISLSLMAIQVLLFLLSWMMKAINPESSLRSLLNREGIRWFWGHFTDNITNRILVWLLFLGMLWGVYKESKFKLLYARGITLSYRERLAIKVFLLECCIILSVVLWLTLAPHAILLSVTGSLFPSSFTSGFIPIFSLIGVFCFASYGFVQGSFRQINHLFKAMEKGISAIAPCIILYFCVLELIASIIYILGY